MPGLWIDIEDIFTIVYIVIVLALKNRYHLFETLFKYGDRSFLQTQFLYEYDLT